MGKEHWNQHTPEYMYCLLQYYFYEVSNDLPQQDIGDLYDHGHLPHQRYKARGNYLFAIGKSLLRLTHQEWFDDEKLAKQIQKQLTQHQWNYEQGKPTTPEEIDLINGLLGQAIAYLIQQKGVDIKTKCQK